MMSLCEHVHMDMICARVAFSSVCMITAQVLQGTPVSPAMSVPLNSWDASEVCVIWSQFCHGWWPFV